MFQSHHKYVNLFSIKKGLKEFVQILDPNSTGRIEYFDFVKGMTNVMSQKTEHFIDEQEFISRSRQVILVFIICEFCCFHLILIIKAYFHKRFQFRNRQKYQ